jgi:hypothetical protein
MTRVLALSVTMRLFVLIACETALIVCAVAAATYLRLGSGEAWIVLMYENGFGKALLVAAVTQTCLYYADLYDVRLLCWRTGASCSSACCTRWRRPR